jgi:hypothetical protein
MIELQEREEIINLLRHMIWDGGTRSKESDCNLSDKIFQTTCGAELPMRTRTDP